MSRTIEEIKEQHTRWCYCHDGGSRLVWSVLTDDERANLRGADLGRAYLWGADLGGADLRGAYLRGAYLRGADLGGADLRGADLRGASLRGADLGGADLRGADLRGARYTLLDALAADFSAVQSSALITEMMRWDAASHPYPQAFQAWANGGDCPLGPSRVGRLLRFDEKRKLYQAGLPVMTLWELWVAIADELEINI